MMKIYCCLVIVFCTFTQYSFAQENPSIDSLQVQKKEPVTIVHTFGLQANELMRQLNLFGSNSSAINNPYLLTYAMRFEEKGIALNLGLGTEIQQNKQREINANFVDYTVNLRLGVTKILNFGKRFELGIGGDFVYGIDSFESETYGQSFNPNTGQFSESVSIVEQTINSYGGGLRLTFDFKITPRILIGTEATYYYQQADNDFSATSYLTEEGPGNVNHPNFSQSTEGFVTNTFVLNPPAVLFMKFRF